MNQRPQALALAPAEAPGDVSDDARRAPICEDSVIPGMENAYELVGRVQSAAYARQVPLNVTLELTLNCNIRCLHCYNLDRDAPPGTVEPVAACGAPKQELSLQERLDVLQRLRDAGTLFLGLTGGEVLTSPHLFPILDRARELNFAVQLLTNGTMLHPGAAGRIASYRNLTGVSISLYGATPEVHDGITQIRGSWRRTWEGARRMRRLGIGVRLKFIVMRQNAHEMAAMRAAADAEGYSYGIDVSITPRHDGTRGSLATRIDEQQVEELYRGPLRDMVPTGKRGVTEETFPCNCARGNCAISAYGDVYPCISVPWPAGNVREQPFIDIWRSSPVFQRIRGLRMADYEACAPCADKAYCSRSRSAAFTYSGSYTGVDPFICRTAAITRAVVTGKSPGE
jgi:radical SAM protein with 4Fe4S-binding SPASM domain